MSLLIMGTGYVGITTALALAELGWPVSGFDPDARKLQLLSQGILPIHEPGLDQLLEKHLQRGGVRFLGDPGQAVSAHKIIFLCVGTPPNPDGSANLRYIREAAETIGAHMTDEKLIVVKSTVPVGTDERIVRWIETSQTARIPFDVVVNPEFLREGSALEDALHPDRIVIGSDGNGPAEMLMKLYERLDCPIIVTTPEAAVMIKYASNAFLATKISFINELSRLCGQLGIDISDVARGMGLDPRIGKLFLRAGIGYGGSCFPKDVDALVHTGKMHGVDLTILERAAGVNRSQPLFQLARWEQSLSSYTGKTIAVLGVAFKPDTDDVREAPALTIIAELAARGANVRVHDPLAKLPVELQSGQAVQYPTIEEVLHGADAAILCTEWADYIHADWGRLKAYMKGNFLFDGRNALDGEALSSRGYRYCGVSKH